MRFVILHYHILKNAGSTIEEALDHSFGERFRRLDSVDRDHTIGNEELLELIDANPSLEAISSHQIRYPLPQIPGILFFDICFLRDPIERVRSLYDYFRKRPAAGDPVSDLANHASPGDFVAGMIEHFPLQIRNVQVNLIAAAGDSDEPTEEDLESATSRMLDSPFPGVVDLFDESIAAGQYRLQTIFPRLNCSHEPVNVSDEKTPHLRKVCAPDVWSELLRLNALDLQLVERVRADVRRRRSLSLPPGNTPAPLDIRQIFDAPYYLASNPDVRAARIDPLRHYLEYGSKEGRKPHPLFGDPHKLFDADSYARDHPEAQGLHPLVHYLKSHRADVRTQANEAAKLKIDDVELTVVFDQPPANPDGAAYVWRDSAGRMQFHAPSQQRRFFQSVSYDQLRAQVLR